MIERSDDLPVSRQAKALGISRGSVYYLPRPVSAEDLSVMHRIDKLHLDYPFAGSRMLQSFLVREGYRIGRRHVATLMKRMGIEALYRRPNTSKPAPGHTIFPYLLRKLPVTRPNQVWATDITYIPMARGFVYLVAVIDWFSRKVLAWRLSITLDTAFCIEAVEEAIARYGKPEIFNSDQGSQGEFNRSSQHFDNGGCGEANRARCRTRCPSRSSISRAAYGGGAGGLPTVLGGNQPWAVKRGGCYRRRSIFSRGRTMVPAGGRDGAVTSVAIC
jgi:hypothetical protein